MAIPTHLIKGLAWPLLSPLLFMGCLSFEITTEPPGADITFDGEYLGKSPCTGHETPEPVGHVYTIIARMPGYQDAIVTFPNVHMIQAIPDTVHIPLKPLPGYHVGPPAAPFSQPATAVSPAEIRKRRRAANQAGPDSPSLQITRLATVPAKVPPGSEFDLEVEFLVTDPVMMSGAALPIKFTYRILQDQNVLLTSQPVWLSVTNNTSTLRSEKSLKATTQRGAYQMEAIIEYKDVIESRSVMLLVR